MPSWLILTILSVALAVAPGLGRSLRRAADTITAAERDLAKREATAWWPGYRDRLRDAAFAASCEYRARHESDPGRRAAWRLIARTRTCTGESR